MLVSDLIAYSQRASGLLGVGQVALPQDTADAQIALMLMLQQWRQKRWLVFRLDYVLFPLISGVGVYSVGPAPPLPGFPEWHDAHPRSFVNNIEANDALTGSFLNAPLSTSPSTFSAINASATEIASSLPSFGWAGN